MTDKQEMPKYDGCEYLGGCVAASKYRAMQQMADRLAGALGHIRIRSANKTVEYDSSNECLRHSFACIRDDANQALTEYVKMKGE